MVYQLSYDLKSPSADYSSVYETLSSFGETLPILKSTWLISSNLSAEQITDSLCKVIQKGDRFIISQITAAQYNGWHAPSTWTWISERLNRPCGSQPSA